MSKKGFPESYDIKRLVNLFCLRRQGDCKETCRASLLASTYNITDDVKCVDLPDVLIIEGLNVLQSGMNYPHEPHRVFISDFWALCSIVDADSQQIKEWYIQPLYLEV